MDYNIIQGSGTTTGTDNYIVDDFSIDINALVLRATYRVDFGSPNTITTPDLKIGTTPVTNIREKDGSAIGVGVLTGITDLIFDGTNLTLFSASVNGGAFIPTSYVHDVATADADPGAGKARLNSLTYGSVIEMYIDDLSDNGNDLSAIYNNILKPGDLIYYQQADDADRFIFLEINGDLVDNTGYFTIPVTFLDEGTGGNIMNDAQVGIIFYRIDADVPATIQIDLVEENFNLSVGTTIRTFRMPYAMTLTDIRINTVSQAPTGSTVIVDLNEGGVTVLSTKVSIDATEFTSVTAATPPVISDANLGDNALMTFDIDQVGSTLAGQGLQAVLIGTRA